MKNIKLYWLRFKSKTPKALRKLQLFFSALLVPVTATVSFLPEGSPLIKVFTTMLIVIPFMVFALQFATDDKELQNHG